MIPTVILPETNWQIRRGEQWAVLGPNGSGKSSLVRVISGDLHAIGGTVGRAFPVRGQGGVGYVSFELHNHLIGRDLWLDHASAEDVDQDLAYEGAVGVDGR